MTRDKTAIPIVIQFLVRCERDQTPISDGPLARTIARATNLTILEVNGVIDDLQKTGLATLEPNGRGFWPRLTNKGRIANGLKPIAATKPAETVLSAEEQRRQSEIKRLIVLVDLSRRSEPTTPMAITNATRVPGGAADVLTGLETDGLADSLWVEAHGSRKSLYSITSEGIRYLEEHQADVAEALEYKFAAKPAPKVAAPPAKTKPSLALVEAVTRLVALVERRPFEPAGDFIVALAKKLRVDHETAWEAFKQAAKAGQVERIIVNGNTTGMRKSSMESYSVPVITPRPVRARDSVLDKAHIRAQILKIVAEQGSYSGQPHKLWGNLSRRLKIDPELLEAHGQAMIADGWLEMERQSEAGKTSFVLTVGPNAPAEVIQRPESPEPESPARVPARLFPSSMPTRVGILLVLRDHFDGKVEDHRGQAVSVLLDCVGLASSKSLNTQLNSHSAAGLIDLDRNARRTHRIAITDAGLAHLSDYEAALVTEEPAPETEAVTTDGIGEIRAAIAEAHQEFQSGAARALTYLAIQPALRAPQSDLGKDLGITPASLEGVVQALLSQGLAYRQRSEIVLTRIGRDMAQDITPSS